MADGSWPLHWHAREAFGFQLVAAMVLVPLQGATFVGFVVGGMFEPRGIGSGLPTIVGVPLLLFTVLWVVARRGHRRR